MNIGIGMGGILVIVTPSPCIKNSEIQITQFIMMRTFNSVSHRPFTINILVNPPQESITFTLRSKVVHCYQSGPVIAAELTEANLIVMVTTIEVLITIQSLLHDGV